MANGIKKMWAQDDTKSKLLKLSKYIGLSFYVNSNLGSCGILSTSNGMPDSISLCICSCSIYKQHAKPKTLALWVCMNAA